MTSQNSLHDPLCLQVPYFDAETIVCLERPTTGSPDRHARHSCNFYGYHPNADTGPTVDLLHWTGCGGRPARARIEPDGTASQPARLRIPAAGALAGSAADRLLGVQPDLRRAARRLHTWALALRFSSSPRQDQHLSDGSGFDVVSARRRFHQGESGEGATQ